MDYIRLSPIRVSDAQIRDPSQKPIPLADQVSHAVKGHLASLRAFFQHVSINLSLLISSAPRLFKKQPSARVITKLVNKDLCLTQTFIELRETSS